MLIVKNISKYYGSKRVVANVNLEARSGEIVALLGPNGAGKTTSFCIIAGIIAASSGQILFDNIDITFVPLYIRSRLGIVYLPQEASIFTKLSVEDNIKVALEIKYKDKKIIAEKLEHLLEDLHIKHIRYSIGNVLSGGERRRVEVARILAMQPAFVLLDEPFAGIDPIAVNDIRQLMFKLTTKNIGILITDHNVAETLRVVDRAYIIYNGEVICHGTPGEIIKNPQVKEVYLGDSFKL